MKSIPDLFFLRSTKPYFKRLKVTCQVLLKVKVIDRHDDPAAQGHPDSPGTIPRGGVGLGVARAAKTSRWRLKHVSTSCKDREMEKYKLNSF